LRPSPFRPRPPGLARGPRSARDPSAGCLAPLFPARTSEGAPPFGVSPLAGGAPPLRRKPARRGAPRARRSTGPPSGSRPATSRPTRPPHPRPRRLQSRGGGPRMPAGERASP